MRYRYADDEVLWPCRSSCALTCGLCDGAIQPGELHRCCMLCADVTGGGYHSRCFRRAGSVHLCPAEGDWPLLEAELLSNETAVVRAVERIRFERLDTERWLRRRGLQAA